MKMKKNKDKNSDTNKAIIDIVLEYLPYLIIILLVIILRTYIVSPIKVNGVSMEPTLVDKELMLLNKIGYYVKGIKRFDIIVIKESDSYLIKRVIGLPDETISYENNNLYINGKRLEDVYGDSITSDFKSIKLESDQYFVLGDNRQDSADSRVFGPVNKDQIKGKTNLIVYPFNKIGKVK